MSEESFLRGNVQKLKTISSDFQSFTRKIIFLCAHLFSKHYLTSLCHCNNLILHPRYYSHVSNLWHFAILSIWISCLPTVSACLKRGFCQRNSIFKTKHENQTSSFCTHKPRWFPTGKWVYKHRLACRVHCQTKSKQSRLKTFQLFEHSKFFNFSTTLFSNLPSMGFVHTLPKLFLLLVSSCLLHVATAVFRCNGEISGVLNQAVLVDGGDCKIAVNATLNGSILVKNGGTLSISDGATINGSIRLESAGTFRVNGRFHIVTINGIIYSQGSSDLFLLCGCKVTEGVTILNQIGEIIIGSGSCSPNTLFGTVKIKGGKGSVQISGSQDGYTDATGELNFLSISDRNRDADVWLWDTNVTNSVFIKNTGSVLVERSNIRGSMKLIRNFHVQVLSVKQSGALQIANTESIVIASQLDNESITRITNNQKGFYLTNSSFNRIKCFGNKGPPLSIKKSSVQTGQGQCKKFQN